MLRLSTARSKPGVHFFAKGVRLSATRLIQDRGVHTVVRSSLKSKVENSASFCVVNTDVRLSQQCCSTFQSTGKTSACLQRFSFHDFRLCGSSRTKRPYQNAALICGLHPTHRIKRAILLSVSDARHKSSDSSQNRNQGENTVSAPAGQWKQQSKSGSSRHGYTLLVAAAVVGTAVYFLSGFKTRYNSNESGWQAQLESVEKNSGSKTPEKIKSLSLQEAIAQATDLCQRVKVSWCSVLVFCECEKLVSYFLQRSTV